LEIQDGGGRDLEKSKKSKNRCISATVGSIATKYGMMTQLFGSFDRSDV